jgi:hypothetical protein
MNLKRTSGLVAVIGLSSLLFPAHAQQPSEDQAPRARRVAEDQNTQKPGVFYRQPVTIDAVPAPAGVGAVADFIQNAPMAAPGPFYYVAGSPNNHVEMELARQAEELARKLGNATPETDKAKIKSQLTEVLDKQFDLRQKRHLEEIKNLEAKVKKLKDLVEKRQENRREIVAKRVDQILRDAEGLGW